jgi:hypothetical protein
VKQRKHPNFLIGGTAAGGTSFLSAILVQHPQIYLPKQMRPEPHYFYKSWEYSKGIDYYLDLWFPDVGDHCVAIGERSSSYLFGGKKVAEKIAWQYPTMKFIFTLRNPIERTWANYRYTALQGVEDTTFEEALNREEERVRAQTGIWAEIQPHNYTGRGFYASQIREFLEVFPRQNLLLIKSELLSLQTDVELRKICRFLGVDSDSFTYERAPDHTSMNVRSPRLQKDLRDFFGERFDLIIEALRKNQSTTEFVRGPEDANAMTQLASNLVGTKMSMSETVRDRLRQTFSADMRNLKKLVDFDISDWK